MKLAVCTLVFLLCAFATESQIVPHGRPLYPYGNFPHYPHHGLPYRHHQGHQIATCHGISRECPEGYTFRLELCGCFKDGDTLPITKQPPPQKPVVVPVPVPRPRPPPPRPRPPIPPPRCPRIFRCTALQVFDESTCRCVCITQINQCPGATMYNKDKCKCECSNRPVCHPYQTFNELLCRCEYRFLPAPPVPLPFPLPPAPLPLPPGPLPLPPAPLPLPPVPLPLPPAPLPQPIPFPATLCPPSANLRCNVFQRLNPQTCQCECRRQIRCSFPKELDPETCECVCRQRTAQRCSSLQTFNDDTCECECTRVFVTVEISVPGPLVPGPSIPGPLVPGPPVPGPPVPRPFPPFLFPRISRTPGGRIRTFRRKRHARKVKEAELYNQNVQGPQANNANHRKRRRTHTGPGPGGFIIPPFLPPIPAPLVPGPPVPGPRVPGPLVPGPSRIQTERRLVPAPCPAGTFVSRNCECF